MCTAQDLIGCDEPEGIPVVRSDVDKLEAVEPSRAKAADMGGV